MMNYQTSREQYSLLFPTDHEKAAAFDQIAEQYYMCNFGSMSKADFDVLMFSIYLDQILDKSEADMNSYSDYKLSKLLGITQSRISSLKVKKELKYPYAGFDWKQSFLRLSENARFENGKIKINIPDKNLYIEIKNFIESNGGFVETQLSPSLLQISPEYYLDLMYEMVDDADKPKIREAMEYELNKWKVDTSDFGEQQKSFGSLLKESAVENTPDLICELLNIIGGPLLSSLAKPAIKPAITTAIRLLKPTENKPKA